MAQITTLDFDMREFRLDDFQDLYTIQVKPGFPWIYYLRNADEAAYVWLSSSTLPAPVIAGDPTVAAKDMSDRLDVLARKMPGTHGFVLILKIKRGHVVLGGLLKATQEIGWNAHAGKFQLYTVNKRPRNAA